MIETALKQYLGSKAALTALVPAARMVCMDRPQATATLPMLVLKRVSSDHEHNLDGAAGSAVVTVQIDVWASSYSSAKTVAEMVRTVLDGYSGSMGDVSTGVFAVGVVWLVSQIDLYTPPADKSQTGVYQTSLDFAIRHTESIPTF